ncbi:MAG: HAD family hydrolase [Acetatifactor sp.]
MLIFFDIDGTLIGEETHRMTRSTGEAIRQARAAGHICMINTGRTGKLIGPEVTGQVEFDGILMGCGTMIVYRGETLLHKTFTEEESLQIMDGLHRHGIDAVLEGYKDNFCESDDRIFSDSFRRFVHCFDSLAYKNYREAPGNFDKFYAYTEEPERMTAFSREFNDRLEFVDRRKGYYEIMPKGYSKASGIKYLADALGIDMAETVAVGDSSNDIAMLECAGVGIAMGNATDDVKAVADYVTTDVEQEGIENALRWLGAIS